MAAADRYESPSSHRVVEERGTYVPAWYKGHADLSLRVVDTDGGDLGFSIGDVLPERRWAIRESGKLIDSQEFENRYRDWVGRIAVKGGQVISMNAVNKYFDVTLETVPPADEFVDAKIDPMRPGELRYIPIGFKSDEATFSRTKIRPIYNANGQKVIAGEPQPEPAPGFVPVPPPPPLMAKSRCGKEMKANRVNQHQAICKECKHFAPGAPEPLDKNGKPLAREAERASA